jgi:RimJ/RimL family protein N-acetyltransferase
VRRVVRFGLEDAQFQRIEIVAAEDNVASRRVAERAGATFECVARNRLLIHGVPTAAAVHSFVPGDLARLDCVHAGA